MSTASGGSFGTTIAPWLAVRDAQEAVDFYAAAFGALEEYRLEGDDGRVAVARLSVGGAPFWVQDDPDASPVAPGVGSVRMIVSVEDPFAAFERAIAAGATVVAPVHDEHGWRTGRLTDPFGHDWELSRELEATPRLDRRTAHDVRCPRLVRKLSYSVRRGPDRHGVPRRIPNGRRAAMRPTRLAPSRAILAIGIAFATIVLGLTVPSSAAPVSAFVRVNQVGYPAASAKRAYLMSSVAETGATFTVRNGGGRRPRRGRSVRCLGSWSNAYPFVYALDFDAGDRGRHVLDRRERAGARVLPELRASGRGQAVYQQRARERALLLPDRTRRS